MKVRKLFIWIIIVKNGISYESSQPGIFRNITIQLKIAVSMLVALKPAGVWTHTIKDRVQDQCSAVRV